MLILQLQLLNYNMKLYKLQIALKGFKIANPYELGGFFGVFTNQLIKIHEMFILKIHLS